MKNYENMENAAVRLPVVVVGQIRQQRQMQSLQKDEDQTRSQIQKRAILLVWLIICGGLLAGCSTLHPRLVSPPLPSAAFSQRTAFFSQSAPADEPPDLSWHTNLVTLAWTPSPTLGVTGGKLYWGTNSGSYDQKQSFGAVTTAVVSLVWQENQPRWWFVVTATDDQGNESPYSNEVHWPPFAPILTGFTLTGQGPVTESPDLLLWQPFTNSLPAAIPQGNGTRFFKGTGLKLAPVWFQPQ